VIGGAERVRLEQGVLGRLLERHVVVEDVGLVGVDVPDGRARHLVGQPLAGERVVEVPELPVEHVRVRELALELVQQAGEAAGPQRVDRVLLVV
jgi:hypothetical protein